MRKTAVARASYKRRDRGMTSRAAAHLLHSDADPPTRARDRRRTIATVEWTVWRAVVVENGETGDASGRGRERRLGSDASVLVCTERTARSTAAVARFACVDVEVTSFPGMELAS